VLPITSGVGQGSRLVLLVALGSGRWWDVASCAGRTKGPAGRGSSRLGLLSPPLPSAPLLQMVTAL